MSQLIIRLGTVTLLSAALWATPAQLFAATPETTPTMTIVTESVPTLSPEMSAIRVAAEEGRVRLEELVARLGAVSGDQASFALQKEIEQAKKETELRIMGIQLAYARQEGRTALATELEAAIAQLRDPRPATATNDQAGSDTTSPRR